jgi:membrane fusion protein (multidrug efflux system)
VHVAVELIDGTKYPHEGAINFHSVQVDPATGTAEVRAELPNPEEALVPGQFVRARVVGLTRRDALTVPQRAVQMGQQSSFVYVVGKDEKVEVREVALSSWVGSDWLVESGLAAGDRVIVDGLQKIRPGSVVKAVEAAAQPAAEK